LNFEVYKKDMVARMCRSCSSHFAYYLAFWAQVDLFPNRAMWSNLLRQGYSCENCPKGDFIL